MKEKNNIDSLFESKLNNKTFELKDAYLADFENKLDIYNKKRRGAVWYIFSSIATIMFLYGGYYIYTSSKLNTESKYITKELEKTNFINIEKTNKPTFTKKHYTKSKNNYNINSTNKTKKNKPNKNNKINKLPSTYNKYLEYGEGGAEANTNNDFYLYKKDEKKQNINNETPSKNIDLENKPIDNKYKNKIDSAIYNNIITKKQEETPVIYIDDTIRRKVVIVDTIVKRDTLIITDTIKNKIRLFKKKR